jgi:hypothetical protein
MADGNDLPARFALSISNAQSMMPAHGRLVARSQIDNYRRTLHLASAKARSFWRLRDGRHYNALPLQKPKIGRFW